MEARTAETLPSEAGWQYEPKWDGFRCLALKAGEAVELRGKSGRGLGRYFPEILALLRDLPFERLIVDGELVIETAGRVSFEDLQARLHPAESRIRKLAAETPARLVLFDLLLAPDGTLLMNEPLRARRRALENLVRNARLDAFTITPRTTDLSLAQTWLTEGYAGTDGVVAKPLDDVYRPGERTMVKVKRLRTADCVVGGFRYGSGSREVGSLLLGLYDSEGKLDHVGFTSALADQDKPALTRKLEALRAPPGFTGKAPGGPSRWSTERSAEWVPVKPELVVEVRFDHVSGGRFRHGTRLLRWRPDKAPADCTFAQVEPPVRE